VPDRGAGRTALPVHGRRSTGDPRACVEKSAWPAGSACRSHTLAGTAADAAPAGPGRARPLPAARGPALPWHVHRGAAHRWPRRSRAAPGLAHGVGAPAPSLGLGALPPVPRTRPLARRQRHGVAGHAVGASVSWGVYRPPHGRRPRNSEGAQAHVRTARRSAHAPRRVGPCRHRLTGPRWPAHAHPVEAWPPSPPPRGYDVLQDGIDAVRRPPTAPLCSACTPPLCSVAASLTH
jgi:hypothetical protein